MKNLLILIAMSLGLVACGGGSEGGSNGSGGGSDHRLGTYSAEIVDSFGVVQRSFNLLVEPDQAVTGGVPENVDFVQLRDGDNVFSRYRYMRNKNMWPSNNMFIEGYAESQAAHYLEVTAASLQDCLDGVTGSGMIFKKILISEPKFTNGGTGTSMTACVLK